MSILKKSTEKNERVFHHILLFQFLHCANFTSSYLENRIEEEYAFAMCKTAPTTSPCSMKKKRLFLVIYTEKKTIRGPYHDRELTR